MVFLLFFQQEHSETRCCRDSIPQSLSCVLGCHHLHEAVTLQSGRRCSVLLSPLIKMPVNQIKLYAMILSNSFFQDKNYSVKLNFPHIGSYKWPLASTIVSTVSSIIMSIRRLFYCASWLSVDVFSGNTLVQVSVGLSFIMKSLQKIAFSFGIINAFQSVESNWLTERGIHPPV